MSLEYWKECVEIACNEIKLELTEKQLECIADSVKGGFENYNTANGYDVMHSGGESQAGKELRELKTEQEKHRIYLATTEPCKTCHTKGLVKDGWGRDVECFACNGKGRIK